MNQDYMRRGGINSSRSGETSVTPILRQNEVAISSYSLSSLSVSHTSQFLPYIAASSNSLLSMTNVVDM